jgi:hypothetical protein
MAKYPVARRRAAWVLVIEGKLWPYSVPSLEYFMMYCRPNGNNMRAARPRPTGGHSSMSDKPPRRHDDPAAFPLPMSGLFADLELGVGCVNLPDDFFAASSAIRIEVLSDWQRALDELRSQALVQLYRDLAAALGDVPDSEKLERFRVTCQSLDIACPDDMAALLQRY